MSEVDESTPLVRTASDDDLVIHARDCLESVWNCFADGAITDRLLELAPSFLVPAANYGQIYAILSAFSVVGARCGGPLRAEGVTAFFIDAILGIVTDPTAPAAVRVAGLGAIRRILLVAPTIHDSHSLIGHWVALIGSETVPLVQALFVRGLAGLVALVDRCVLPDLTGFLIGALDGATLELAHEVIGALGAIVRRGSYVSIEAAATPGQVLLAFAGPDCDVATRLRALLSFSGCFAGVQATDVVRCRDEMLEMTDAFLRNALEVAAVVTGDEEMGDCQRVLVLLLGAMGPHALPYAKPVLAAMREIVAAPLQVWSCMEYSGDGLDLPFMARIESESGSTQYVEQAAIDRVNNALLTMAILLKIPDESLAEDVGLAIELIGDRMGSEQYIPAIEARLWQLLLAILGLPDLPLELCALPLKFLLEKDRPSRPTGVFVPLLDCVESAIEDYPVVEPDHQVAIVARCVKVFLRAADAVEALVEQQRQFDAIDESDMVVSTLIQRLAKFHHFMNIALKEYPEAAAHCMRESLVPAVTPWLELPSLRFVAIGVLATFFAATGEPERLSELIECVRVAAAAERDAGLGFSLFGSLTEVFRTYRFADETCLEYATLIADFLDNPAFEGDEVDSCNDEAIVALSALLRTNLQDYTNHFLIDDWFSYLPLEAAPDLWDLPALLLADVMEQRLLSDWDEDDLTRILPWFFVLPMLSSVEPETAGRLLQWLHRMLVFYEGKPDDLVTKVITTLVHNGRGGVTESVNAVIQCARLQPLEGLAIPYEEHSGVVKAS
jgi:hypothetical protein